MRRFLESNGKNSAMGFFSDQQPCKSQPAKSKSQPANTKVSRELAGLKGYDDKPGWIGIKET